MRQTTPYPAPHVLQFPFWIATQRRGLVAQPVEVAGVRGVVAVFSSAEDLARFLVARGETDWENRPIVGRATLSTLLGDLRQIGMRGFCLNPGVEGGGAMVLFEQVECS